jgi:D-beta-D-heptose 7-phosphate kinase/D-beta-D-heptose 1-phosphate adenosyltransferase
LHKGRVLVIGDLILDEFIWGRVNRISPEAPVPVVWVESETFMPGGAANVANNIHALGGKVFLAGVVGNDKHGEILVNELKKKGIDTEGVAIDQVRPTTLKSRVVAHHQQVVRIDREKVEAIEQGTFEQIITCVREKISQVDAVIIEDYGKGVVSPRLIQEVNALCQAHKKIVSIDPKENHFAYYKDTTLLTPNHHEAAKAAGFEIKDEATLNKAGQVILEKIKCRAVLITLGENGMRLFEQGAQPVHIPTVAQEVFDVSGAGDTVIATATLCLACKATFKEAAYIANFAAGIVVGKVGIAVATQEELLARLEPYEKVQARLKSKLKF